VHESWFPPLEEIFCAREYERCSKAIETLAVAASDPALIAGRHPPSETSFNTREYVEAANVDG
jgi:hypothetical protein